VLYAVNILGFFAAPFVAVFLMGLFTRWATPTAAFVTVLASVPVSLAFNVYFPRMSYLYRIPIVFGFCVAVMVVVSAFTKSRPYESIKNLLWRPEDVFRADTGLLVSATDAAAAETVTTQRLPLYKDYRLVAVIATVLTAVMFYVFR
jgi:Na+/proline symporter